MHGERLVTERQRSHQSDHAGVQRHEVDDRAEHVREADLRPAAPGRDDHPRDLLALDRSCDDGVPEQRLRNADVRDDLPDAAGERVAAGNEQRQAANEREDDSPR